MIAFILLHFRVSFTWLQVILLLAGGLLLIQIVQRITRKKNPEEQALLDAWHKDPANWKAVVFYFNRKDHRIFPPKRISGLGWTINFANPLSILTFACVLIIVILLIGSLS